MVYFTPSIFKLILDYADTRIEDKQKYLHGKVLHELLEYFIEENDVDYAYFLYSLMNYHIDIAGNLMHNNLLLTDGQESDSEDERYNSNALLTLL